MKYIVYKISNTVNYKFYFGVTQQPLEKRWQQHKCNSSKKNYHLYNAIKKYGFKIMFGGTDNHMVLVDVFSSKGISGKEAEKALDKIGITVNKNMIPDDPRKPMDPSGVRIGVPAITTRRMKEKEVKIIAGWINQAVENHANEKVLADLHKEVIKLCKRFPLPK